MGTGRSPTSASALKPVQGLPGATGTPSAASIHELLSQPPFNQPQALLEVVASLKAMLGSNPEQARQLLASNPGLAYALLQAFISLNLVDMGTVQSLLAQVQQQRATPPAPNAGGAVHAPPSAPAPAEGLALEQQRAVIMQIMGMTPEQINQLPAQQREQVLQLRQQIQAQQASAAAARK